MLCCRCLNILTNFWMRGSHFPFGLGSRNYRASPGRWQVTSPNFRKGSKDPEIQKCDVQSPNKVSCKLEAPHSYSCCGRQPGAALPPCGHLAKSLETFLVVPALGRTLLASGGSEMFNPTNAQASPHNKEYWGPKFLHCWGWKTLHNSLFVSPTLGTNPGRLLSVCWTSGCSLDLRWLYSLPKSAWSTNLVVIKWNLAFPQGAVQRCSRVRHVHFSHLTH